MRGLWGEAPFTYRGPLLPRPDAVCRPRPVQQPGPPIMLGGSGNGILRRAGEWADIIHMVPVIGAGRDDDAGGAAASSPTSAAREAGARARRGGAGGPAAGSVRFASTVFNYSTTESTGATAGVGGAYGRRSSV